MELEQEDGQESTENEVSSKLTDSEILNSIETKAGESYGYMSSTLNAEREQALDY